LTEAPHRAVVVKLSSDDLLRLIYEQLCGPIDPTTGHGGGWPQLGQDGQGNNPYLVDAVASLVKTVDELKKAQAITRRPRSGNTRSKVTAIEVIPKPGRTQKAGGDKAKAPAKTPAKATKRARNGSTGR
jgi:hypothetical protein